MADTFLDATAQAELVRTGRASALELVDDAIARVEKLDPELNAVIHPRFDKARDEARATLPDSVSRPSRSARSARPTSRCSDSCVPRHSCPTRRSRT